jgi:hypothetical protein
VSYRWLFQSWLVLCLVAVSWAEPALARSMSLRLVDVLASDESFSVGDSSLSFSNFDLVSNGADVRLRLLRIKFDETGFKITGPLRARRGQDVELILSYVVQADAGLAVSEADLAIRGSANRGSVEVSESFQEVPDILLSASIESRGARRVQDEESLGAGSPTLHVTKTIVLDSFEVEGRHRPRFGHANLTRIDQHFDVHTQPIPEPGAALLVGIGIAGLAFVRVRSR